MIMPVVYRRRGVMNTGMKAHRILPETARATPVAGQPALPCAAVPTRPEPSRVRSLFISDIHLGTRACRAEALLGFLAACEVERIYLVGDIVDGWRLKARWHWPSSHDAVVRCLLAKLQEGTRVLYIPGNHDEFLRGSLGLRLGGIEVVEDAVHVAADGRRYLVVHGDQFDTVVRRMRRLAALGIWVYAIAVMAHDGAARSWRRLRRRRGPVDDVRFAAQAAEAARRLGLDGVICGHVHRAAMRDVEGVHYVNTGDWVESCTAVVEHEDGRLEMLCCPDEARAAAPARGAWHEDGARLPVASAKPG
jgi:UDP-2,3-diacylglucosamine pyrophosphatase LpxH